MRKAQQLTPAASHADFAEAPIGRWTAGPSFIYAWVRPDLCVSVLWGQPQKDDLEALAKLYALELAADAPAHASLIDARRIEGVDPAAFAVLTRYVASRRGPMSKKVTRLAIVRPDGFVGALAAGFYSTVPPPYPVEVFADLASAMQWAGGEPELTATLEQIVAESADLPDLLRDLRRTLDARLPETDVEAITRDLGLTVRTLQRRLSGLGTTYRKEVVGAQLRRAEHWLATTDEPVSRIAYEVGFRTPQHLSALFRQAHGLTPSAWRARHRASD